MTIPAVETQSKIKEYLTWVELDPCALESNLEKIKMLTLPSAEILAVVKANGYGHGILEIAKVLEKKVGYFGVASVEEALKLRQYEIAVPILLFGVHFETQIEQAIQAHMTISVSSLDQANMIHEVATRLRQAAVIHIKVDTGMGRLGIPLRAAKTVISKIHQLDSLKLEGIYTHFPAAEKLNNPMTERQTRGFHSLLSVLAERGISFAYRHAANSAGLFHHRGAHFNLVRPGLSLYGIYSDESLVPKTSLTPVLNWRARVILVKELMRGDSVGYGQTYIAKEETKIAILPIGYSHGYPFALSGKSRVLIQGKSYKVIGRVSMDYIVIELGRDSVQIGEVATILGKDGNDSIRAEELALLAGTIPYEIVARINPQIPRIVL